MKKGLGILFMLTLVVVVASVGVFFVEDITTPIIQERQTKEIQEAVKEVFPDIVGTSWTVVDSELDFSGTPIVSALEIKDGDTLQGIVYTVTFRGFANDFTYVVGVNRSGAITGYKTLKNNETASSAGDFDLESTFSFLKGTLLEVASGSFDGVSGATYTSNYWKTSLTDVASWHASAGVFPELTQLAKDTAIITSRLNDPTLTVTEKVLTDAQLAALAASPVDTVYEAKGDSGDYVVYIEEYDSYEMTTKVLLIVDLDTNETVKFEVLENADTPDWGGVLLSETTRWTQLEEQDMPFLMDGDFDDLGGATTTYRTWQDAMFRIGAFHQELYQGIVSYSVDALIEGYKNQLSTVSSPVITDVTEQKVSNSNISNVYDVKDSSGTYQGTIYQGYTFGAYSNMPTLIYFMVGIDAAGNYTGFRIYNATDAAILASNLYTQNYNDYDTPGYFAEEIEGVAITTQLSLTPVDGLTIQVNNIEDVINEIGRYHTEDYNKRDNEVIPEAELLKALDGSASFVEIYNDYFFTSGVLNVYEAYDATDTLIGYVYAGTYVGDYSRKTVKYTLGVKLDGTTGNINVYQDGETWDEANDYASYDGSQGRVFSTSPWLDNFEGLNITNFIAGYTPAASPENGGVSNLIDDVAGVSTTSGGNNTNYGLIDSVYTVLKFHTDNSVGGGN